MTMLNVPFPINMSDANDPIPHKYISIKRSQECSCCHLVHEWCELYSYTELKSSLGYRRVENLRKLDWPKYRLPIEQWEDEERRLIPWCHDCYQPSLMQSGDMLDPPPPISAPLHTYEPPPKPKPPSDPAKRVPRTKEPLPVDNLLDMLK